MPFDHKVGPPKITTVLSKEMPVDMVFVLYFMTGEIFVLEFDEMISH